MKTYSFIEYTDNKYEILEYGEEQTIKLEVVNKINILLDMNQVIELRGLNQDWQKRQFILNNI